MPIRKRPDLIGQGIEELRGHRAHEITGDNYPVEEGEEYESPSQGPRVDPLAELRELPSPQPESPLTQIITYGQQIGRIVTVPAVSGHLVEILAIRSEDSLNSMFSVTLSERSNNPSDQGIGGVNDDFRQPPAGINLPNTIQVEWGAGGAQFVATVDATRGQSFTVGGSYLRLIARNGGSVPPGGGALIEYDVGAFVSLLPKGEIRKARFTRNWGAIGAAGSLPAAFPAVGMIPNFAITVKPYRAPQTAPFTFAFYDVTGAIIAEYNVPASSDPPEIPIPGNARNMNILNGATPITNFGFLFQLDL